MRCIFCILHYFDFPSYAGPLCIVESRNVEKEPEDITFLESVDDVKNQNDTDVGDDAKNNTNKVRVEHGQDVEVINYSTWTQDNYLDYYGYVDEETELFPFEPGEIDVHFTTSREM